MRRRGPALEVLFSAFASARFLNDSTTSHVCIVCDRQTVSTDTHHSVELVFKCDQLPFAGERMAKDAGFFVAKKFAPRSSPCATRGQAKELLCTSVSGHPV